MKKTYSDRLKAFCDRYGYGAPTQVSKVLLGNEFHNSLSAIVAQYVDKSNCKDFTEKEWKFLRFIRKNNKKLTAKQENYCISLLKKIDVEVVPKTGYNIPS